MAGEKVMSEISSNKAVYSNQELQQSKPSQGELEKGGAISNTFASLFQTLFVQGTQSFQQPVIELHRPVVSVREEETEVVVENEDMGSSDLELEVDDSSKHDVDLRKDVVDENVVSSPIESTNDGSNHSNEEVVEVENADSEISGKELTTGDLALRKDMRGVREDSQGDLFEDNYKDSQVSSGLFKVSSEVVDFEESSQERAKVVFNQNSVEGQSDIEDNMGANNLANDVKKSKAINRLAVEEGNSLKVKDNFATEIIAPAPLGKVEVSDVQSGENIPKSPTQPEVGATDLLSAAMLQQDTGSGFNANTQGDGGRQGLSLLAGSGQRLKGGSKGTAYRHSIPKTMQDKIISRIQKMLDSAKQTRFGTTMTVRLDPQELGALTLKLSQRSDQLFAKVSPESKEVESMLRSRVHEIAGILSNAGFKADNVHVSIGAITDTVESQFSSMLSDNMQGQTEQDWQRGGRNDDSLERGTHSHSALEISAFREANPQSGAWVA